MRWVLCILLVAAACKSKGEHVPAPQPGSAAPAAPAPDDAWGRIETLATPALSTPGPATELERVLALAEKNEDSWREHKYDHPAPTIDRFPHGAEAVAGLTAWASAKGGLPATPSPATFAVVPMHAFHIGSLAVTTARTRDELAPAIYLGTLMLAAGRNMLEAQMGCSLLSEAQLKARELRAFDAPPQDPIPVPDLDLVRTLAAEALQMRRNNDWLRTPDGKKEMEAKIDSLGSSSIITKEQAASLTPTGAEAAAYKVFWLAALEGAQRGEPAGVTLARLQKAVDGAPSSIKDTVARIAGMVEMLQSSVERAKKPPF